MKREQSSLGTNPFLAAVVPLVLATSIVAQEPQKTPAGGQLVLDDHSYWRTYLTVSPPTFGKTAAEAKPEVDKPKSPAPPADWTKPDFDDSSWYRTVGRAFEGHGWTGNRPGGQQWAGQLCLRGKFIVNDPAAVKSLSLSTVYRGGMIVYLNGKEVARGNIAAGEVTPDTAAQEYPWEAYIDADNKGLTKKLKAEGVVAERLNMRIRKLENIILPADALRKGVNVIAVDLRRAPINPDSKALGWESYWSTMGMLGIKLTAEGAVEPNLVRPKGVQVWNANQMTSVFDADYCNPAETLKPVTIIGARGQSFSGQVILSSDQPIVKPSAKISDLTSTKGSGKIAAGDIRIRYALATGSENDSWGRFRGISNPLRFDTLAETAPEKVAVAAKNVRKEYSGPALVHGAVLPVWITIKVPRDAAPGDYTGNLTIAAEGITPPEVQVNLHVAEWVAPDTKDFNSHVGLTPSPETEAIYYKKPMWSEEHWALVERCMKYMGEAGGSAIFLPLVAKHHYGKESMVRWVRKADGTYDYDFTVFDRYVDLAVKHLTKIQVACLYAWEPTRSITDRGKRPPEITVLDPETKQTSETNAPAYNAPEAADFWKPVMAACKEHLTKRGIDEKALMVGMASDRHPDKAEVDLFKQVAPWARWVKQAHGDVGQFAGVPVGHLAFVWGTHGLKDPSEKRVYYWKTEQVRTVFPRAGACKMFRAGQSMCNAWTLQEYLVAAGYRGIGRIGVDFWPIYKGANRHYGGDTMAGLHANWGQTTISESVLDLFQPGPDGCLMTVRLETFRQGVLDAEARIVIDKILVDKAKSAKIGDLAKKAQDLLDERARIFLAYDGELQIWHTASGWQERDKALFAMAGEVAKAAGDAK